jgi:rubrerythrin
MVPTRRRPDDEVDPIAHTQHAHRRREQPSGAGWSLREQLDLAIRIENVAAGIYQVLAERFADEPEARALFLRLEQEERQHALRIEMLGMALARRPELEGRRVLDVEQMLKALRDGEDVATALAAPGSRLPLDRARRLAAQLEERFAAVHAEQLASVGEPSLRDLFAIFVAQDRGHAALLRGPEPEPEPG